MCCWIRICKFSIVAKASFIGLVVLQELRSGKKPKANITVMRMLNCRTALLARNPHSPLCRNSRLTQSLGTHLPYTPRLHQAHSGAARDSLCRTFPLRELHLYQTWDFNAGQEEKGEGCSVNFLTIFSILISQFTSPIIPFWARLTWQLFPNLVLAVALFQTLLNSSLWLTWRDLGVIVKKH